MGSILTTSTLEQMDTSRLHRITKYAKTWDGPISAVVIAKTSEKNSILKKYREDANENVKDHVDLHVAEIGEAGFQHYPINRLRNLANSQATTESTAHNITHLARVRCVFWSQLFGSHNYAPVLVLNRTILTTMLVLQ